MVFRVLDHLVVPLLSTYGAIVPALITYINDPTGGEAQQTNRGMVLQWHKFKLLKLTHTINSYN